MCRAVQRVFRWAEQQGIIERSPVTHVEKPPLENREIVISENEYRQILTCIKDQVFGDVVVTAWETGARPQEITAVEARHVDFDRSRWAFPISESKGKRTPRVVYLTDTAMEITRRLVAKNPNGKLFRNVRGRPWYAYSINCRFYRLKERLGKRYCLYGFRHTWATRAMQRLDPLTTAILLGHANAATLSMVYQHASLCPDFLRAAVKKAVG